MICRPFHTSRPGTHQNIHMDIKFFVECLAKMDVHMITKRCRSGVLREHRLWSLLGTSSTPFWRLVPLVNLLNQPRSKAAFQWINATNLGMSKSHNYCFRVTGATELRRYRALRTFWSEPHCQVAQDLAHLWHKWNICFRSTYVIYIVFPHLFVTSSTENGWT